MAEVGQSSMSTRRILFLRDLGVVVFAVPCDVCVTNVAPVLVLCALVFALLGHCCVCVYQK